VREGAVAHFERGWTGAGGTVSSRRSTVLDRAELDAAGPLAAEQHLVRQVILRVPADEATVDGYLVQQQCTVRARLRLAHGRDPEAGAAVRVVSAAANRSWVTDTAAVADDAGIATLGIEELSTRQLHGGVPISGRVTVAPHRVGRADGVRVELVLDERVPARLGEMPLEEDRGRTSVVAAVPLIGSVDLEPGRVLQLPFTIRGPVQLPAPSISAPEFTLRWLLRAVLDRPLHRDPTTTLELWGATAP
jgi:hypothetical protein